MPSDQHLWHEATEIKLIQATGKMALNEYKDPRFYWTKNGRKGGPSFIEALCKHKYNLGKRKKESQKKGCLWV